MRILKLRHETSTLQDCFSVFVFPRIIISLYLLTLGYKQVAGVKNKSPPANLPAFRDTPSDYTFTEGETAKLYCSIHNLGTRTVVWRKASNPNPLTVGPMTYVDDTRFQIAHVPEKDEWNLMIKNVNKDDAGMYECQVSTKEKYIRKLVRVIVKERPYPERAIYINGPQIAKKGETIVLSCNATNGKSAPQNLSWEKDSVKLKTDKVGRINITKHISYISQTTVSNLTIKDVQKTDKGMYVCKTPDGMQEIVTIEVNGEGAENVKRGITQDAPATSCATSSTVMLYMFVFLLHCSLHCGKIMTSLTSIFRGTSGSNT